jgi:hypothetical protein
VPNFLTTGKKTKPVNLTPPPKRSDCRRVCPRISLGHCPAPVPGLINRRVLVMGYLKGVPLSRAGEEMVKTGIDPESAPASVVLAVHGDDEASNGVCPKLAPRKSRRKIRGERAGRSRALLCVEQSLLGSPSTLNSQKASKIRPYNVGDICGGATANTLDSTLVLSFAKPS